jgi:two-component system, NarL family, sensor histidine kinase UhpB
MSPPRRDALIVLALTVGAAVLSVHFDLSEKLHRWTAPWERFQLDEIPGVLWVLALGLIWFAVRRYREAGRDLMRRRAAEARLTTALGENRRLSQQYVQHQEAERKGLAQELHDELGQYLNAIKLDAVGIRDARLADEAAVRERSAAIVENCNHIHQALADLIRQLRPVGLDELGLAAAVEHCMDAWRPRLPRTDLRLFVSGELSDLPETVALTAFRLVQEALTNVAKHASAGHVTVELARGPLERGPLEPGPHEPGPHERGPLEPGPLEGPSPGRGRLEESASDHVRITVEDDGVGSDSGAPTRGLGLLGMRERVTALDGDLEVATSRDHGFRLTARIPVQYP